MDGWMQMKQTEGYLRPVVIHKNISYIMVASDFLCVTHVILDIMAPDVSGVELQGLFFIDMLIDGNEWSERGIRTGEVQF